MSKGIDNEVSDLKIDLDPIRALADLAVEKDLNEIEYETSKQRIRLVRQAPAGSAAADPAPLAVQPAPAAAASAAEAPGADDDAFYIESPMVGTFYSAPAPDAPPFVETGDRIEKGRVVCIVEAMKLMNEIEAETGGVVAEQLVENGQGVEFGQRLFKIVP